ncbi:VC0807 family protein [Nonomuraea antri]|uniref:VC0807 family protein n=1 Tax=Nonomuraea antri TaxID=2730852 RepID=UPI002E2C4BAF|nr:VC0807 family protein [Nonomuraea antri]
MASSERTVTWQVMLVLILLIYVIAPIAAYYTLRTAGLAAPLALLAGGLIPVAAVAHKAVRGGGVDGLDAFGVGAVAIGGVIALLRGAPRFLLLMDCLAEAVAGAWVLATIVLARPLAFEIGRQLGAPRERAWRESPDFRRAIRTVTALWGAALVLDAALVAGLALTLPVDLVPALRPIGLVFPVAAAVAGTVCARRYRRRHGHRLIVPDSGRVPLAYQRTSAPPPPG